MTLKQDLLVKLRDSRASSYSQNGEDGILDFIFRVLPQGPRWCVEFGAWDGIYLSNTFLFIERFGWRGVLIEADIERFRTLQDNMDSWPVECLNEFVGYSRENHLDALLARTEVPRDFDLLSIDIDGDDYHVWRSLTSYSPRVVVIETNSFAKPPKKQIHAPGSPYTDGVQSGTSIASMTDLAQSKGYALLANCASNTIFLRKEYLPLFCASELSPEDVFTYEHLTYSELTPAERELRAFWGFPLEPTFRDLVVARLPAELRGRLRRFLPGST